jgi:DNA-binding CsgD family transcriptional regulator
MDPVGLAQESKNAAEFERIALDGLTSLIGAEAAFFATTKSVTATLLDPASLARAFDDPRLQREMVPLDRAAASARGVCVDTDVLGEARERAAYFREFAAPLGGRHSLFATLTVRGRFYGKIMLGRLRAREFSAHDIERMQQLLPSLAIARASFEATIQPRFQLSPRERDVLEYLCLGYTNREIASACGTSANTVRNQLVSLFEKLGASTRAEAVAIARA